MEITIIPCGQEGRCGYGPAAHRETAGKEVSELPSVLTRLRSTQPLGSFQMLSC